MDVNSVLYNYAPILAASFAVNVGYLYIPWFHYLERIREIADEVLKEGTDTRTLLLENEHDDDVQCVMYIRTLGKSRMQKKSMAYKKCNLWNKAWCYFLKIFTWHLDRIVVSGFLILVVSLQVIGVAHQVGVYDQVLVDLTCGQIHFLLHTITLSIFTPMLMAFIAYWLKRGISDYVLKVVGATMMSEKKQSDNMVDDTGEALVLQRVN